MVENKGWCSILLLLSWAHLIYGYPSTPGTCNIDLMATLGHGPSKSTCKDCYGIKIQPSEDSAISDITIKVLGTQLYQGIMLLVRDQSNQIVGQFVNYDEDKLSAVACDDEDVSEDTEAVIGHMNPNIKSFPVEVGWKAGDIMLSQFKVQAMVVIDYDNFHIIPEQSFKLEKNQKTSSKSSAISSSSSTITTTTTIITKTTTVIQPFPKLDDSDTEEEWPLNSPNPFFLKVVLSVIAIYLIMSLLLRYIKSKQQKNYKSNQDDANISLHIVKSS